MCTQKLCVGAKKIMIFFKVLEKYYPVHSKKYEKPGMNRKITSKMNSGFIHNKTFDKIKAQKKKERKNYVLGNVSGSNSTSIHTYILKRIFSPSR